MTLSIVKNIFLFFINIFSSDGWTLLKSKLSSNTNFEAETNENYKQIISYMRYCPNFLKKDKDDIYKKLVLLMAYSYNDEKIYNNFLDGMASDIKNANELESDSIARDFGKAIRLFYKNKNPVLLSNSEKILDYVKELREEKAKNKMSGILKTNSITILSAKENKYPLMELGYSGAIIPIEPVKKTFKNLGLTMKLVDNKLYLSCLVRDISGNLIAKIVDNEWQVNNNNYLDRNYSEDSIEVIDNKDNIVLQVCLKSDRVQFQGILYDENGKGFLFHTGGTRGGIMQKISAKHPPSYKIKALFKYFSDLHIGEYA